MGYGWAVLKTFRNVGKLAGAAAASDVGKRRYCLRGLRGVFLFSLPLGICRDSKFDT
jgi:hypothetical protein